MWEEPRPERLRRRNSDRSGDPFRLVAACAVIFGLAVILHHTGVIDWGRKSEPEPLPPAQTTPREPPARVPVAPRPQSSRDAHSPRDPGGTRPAVRSRPPAGTARGDPNVMRSLTDTCRYWIQQNTQGQYSGNQEMACREMTMYARQHGFPVPAVGGAIPQLPPASRDSQVGSRITVQVDQCDRHGYGTVNYRQCRAGEQRRLNDWCKRLRDDRDRAQGTRRDTLNQHVSAVCSEADRYQIVR
jgi:hypothetical protein